MANYNDDDVISQSQASRIRTDLALGRIDINQARFKARNSRYQASRNFPGDVSYGDFSAGLSSMPRSDNSYQGNQQQEERRRREEQDRRREDEQRRKNDQERQRRSSGW